MVFWQMSPARWRTNEPFPCRFARCGSLCRHPRSDHHFDLSLLGLSRDGGRTEDVDVDPEGDPPPAVRWNEAGRVPGHRGDLIVYRHEGPAHAHRTGRDGADASDTARRWRQRQEDRKCESDGRGPAGRPDGARGLSHGRAVYHRRRPPTSRAHGPFELTGAPKACYGSFRSETDTVTKGR